MFFIFGKYFCLEDYFVLKMIIIFWNDAARHRADVGAAVAADVRLVAHAAETHAHIFALQGFGDALAPLMSA